MHVFLVLLAAISVLDIFLFHNSVRKLEKHRADQSLFDTVTSGLGLTDLCVSTEARYTRHPAVSDPVAPFMDHPGAVEHFPSGSFWIPPSKGSGLGRN